MTTCAAPGCDVQFRPRQENRLQKLQIYHSLECWTAARNGGRILTAEERAERERMRIKVKCRTRRLRRAESWDGVTDQEILDRDRWVCGICHKRIGKTFTYPHPRSKSIDHIVPLSQHGDDTAANKRAAHLVCNMARGNGGGGEQLALVG